MILIDFESYENGVGNNAVLISKYAEDVSRKLNVPFVLVPQFFDLSEIAKSVNIPVYCPFVDNLEGENYTGRVIAKNALKVGCRGSILDCTRLSFNDISSTIDLCKNIGFKIIVKVKTLDQLRKMQGFFPDYIIYRPEEADSVKFKIDSSARELAERAVEISGSNLIWEGGIEDKKDIETLIFFGIEAVVLSHQIIQSKNLRKVINDFASKFI